MTDQERIAHLEERVHDLTQATLHLFTCLTGQRVDELALRALIEKLGAHTRTKVPNGVTL